MPLTIARPPLIGMRSLLAPKCGKMLFFSLFQSWRMMEPLVMNKAAPIKLKKISILLLIGVLRM